MKCAVSAQKALQGSETETTEKNNINPDEGSLIFFPVGKLIISFEKSKQRMTELVARPVPELSGKVKLLRSR